MGPFEYVTPANKEQAIGLLGAAWGQTEILAGGTDLLALMKDDVVRPKRLVNIKEIAELRGVSAGPQGLRIGALTTLGELADNANVLQTYPALASALQDAASPQIRNMATLGGNLSQRPRCWYFRGGFGLLPKDESGKDLVALGENRYHAILANDGPAKFVSPSTIAPVLIAYGASIRITGAKGTRELPLEKYYVIPKSETQREHDLRPNEMVTEILIPQPPRDLSVSHYEVRQKAAFDWPLATASAALRMNGSQVQSARVVIGHVAPIPWLSAEATQVLMGKNISEELVLSAATESLQSATPLRHNVYKIQLARVAVKRAILKAAGGAA